MTPLAIAFLTLPILAVDGAPPGAHASADPADVVANRLIVRFEPAAPAGLVGDRSTLPHATRLRRLLPVSPRRPHAPAVDGPHQIYLVELAAGIDPAEAAMEIAALPHVRYAEPDHIVRIDGAFPDDPDLPELWGLHNTGQTGGTPDADIDAPEAWALSTGSADVIVAVIDTGVDYNHPDLAPNMWVNPGESGDGRESDGIDNDGNGYVDDVFGYDFRLGDPDPMDANSHGTHVAGTIAAAGDNGLGVVGVNWTARVMALRFLGAGGSGATAAAVEALYYAIDNGARVVNASWGGGAFSIALLDALIEAQQAGVLFVASAGNSAANNDQIAHYPSAYDAGNVIAVASTDHHDGLSSFSNWGLNSVDLGAPGSSIFSTQPPYVTLFSENFQSASPPSNGGQFTMAGAPNYWGTVETNGNLTARGDVDQSYPYRPNAVGWIVSPPLDTTGLPGLSLSFNYRYETEQNDDALIVEVWNGAAWVEIFRRSGSNSFQPFFWFTRLDLEPWRNPFMQVRFGWQTDGDNNNYFGVEIDNVTVRCVGTAYDGGNAYGLMSGTSMAAPHVSGVAALLLSAEPALPLTALRQRILESGDPLPALAGITVTGKRINAYGALAGASSLTVSAPNGAEIWTIGSNRTITWSSPGGGGVVNLLLLKGGEVFMPLALGQPDNGSFDWLVPSGLPEAWDYRVRVESGPLSDASDGEFAIICAGEAEPLPVLDNGGPNWTAGVSISPRTTANRVVAPADIAVSAASFHFVQTTPAANIGPTLLWLVYNEVNGQPGDILWQGVAQNLTITDLESPATWDWFRGEFDLGQIVPLAGGMPYWLALHAPAATVGEGVGWARSAAPMPGSAVMWKFPGQSWTSTSLPGLSFVLLHGASGCPGDLNGDGIVNTQDLVMVVLSWGLCDASVACPADFDCDAIVGSLDLFELLASWGVCD